MSTPADAALTRARDTHDPHPDDREYETPDGRATVVVDGHDDLAHVDAPDGLSADQLADLIACCRRAQLHLEGRPDRCAAIDRHVEQQARHVADAHTAAQVRAHLDWAQIVGRTGHHEDLEVRVWRRAADLHALIDAPATVRHVELAERSGQTDMLEVLGAIDAGQLQWRAGGEDGPLLVDVGDDTTPRGVCDQQVMDTVADLRAGDDLVELHVMATTDLGWAVVRAAHRRLRLVPGIGA